MSGNQTIELIRRGRRGEDAAEFWRRLHAGRLAIQCCADCEAFRFPPGPGCPSCGCVGATWVEPATPPELFAWTVTRPPSADRVPAKLAAWMPYALVLVRFPDVHGILLPALLEGDGIDSLAAGARMVITGGSPERPRLTAELASP
jgi:uncharacterized protein